MATKATSLSGSVAPQKAPGPPGLLGLSSVGEMERDPLSFLVNARERYGDIAGMRLFGLQTMLVSHPDAIRHILQERHTIYTKQNADYRMLARVLGQGLVTSDGAFWLRQRRLIQPAFHRERIRGFADLMQRESEASAERLAEAARTGATVDVIMEAQRTTLDIVLEALFGIDSAVDTEEIGDAFSNLNELLTAQFTSVLGRIPWLPTQTNLALKAGKRRLDAMVDGIIARRRASKTEGNDLLGMLLDSRDEETGEGMSDEQLRDEVTTLLVAGHETTTMLMGWAVYLLGRNPGQAKRVHAEVQTVLGDRSAGLEDLPDLEITRRVLEETMRLYPPAWAVSRTPSEDDEINGYRIPKGALVFISPWVTHRHPEFWDDPERFDPDRFEPEREKQRAKFAHFPFLAGPRMCIGFAFAAMEARIMLATWLGKVRLPLAQDQEIEPDPLVTLRPKGGVLVQPQLL